MSTCNLWFLPGRNEKGGSLFVNLLRNRLSCSFLSAFELPLIPFLSLAMLKSCWAHRAHSEGTLPLHLFFSSDQGWLQRNQVWEGEFSALSPTYHFPSRWNVLTLLVMPYDIPQNSFTDKNFPRVGTQHSPANCLTVQKLLESYLQV